MHVVTGQLEAVLRIVVRNQVQGNDDRDSDCVAETHRRHGLPLQGNWPELEVIVTAGDLYRFIICEQLSRWFSRPLISRTYQYQIQL